MPLLGKTTKYAKFLGRPVLYTQSLGALGALMGAATELGVAALIQMLLVALKVSPQPTSGLLSHWVITIEMVGWALLALALLRSGALFLTNFAPAFAGDLFQERLRNFLVHWIVHSPHPPSLTRTQTLLGDTIPKTAQFANFISYAFPILVQMAALVGVMVAMCPKEAAVALCLLVVVGFVVLKLNRRVRHLSHDLPMAQRTVVQTIERVAYNWLLVYVLGTQRQEQSRFETHAREFTAKSKKAHFWVCLAAAAAPALGILILILVIFLSQKVFLTSASRLLTFLYLFVRFVQLGAAVTHYFGSLNSLWPFFKDCYNQFIGIAQGENQELHLKKADAKDSDLASEGGALVTRTPLAPSCEVENLSFSHGADKELFAQMNLKVGSGSQVGIVGPSGAGKSTLLQLLLGVLRPKKGQVLWAGLDPQQLLRSRPGQSRMRVGYVGAEPFLFSGTLEENLVYGCQEPPSASQMLAVLRKLNLHTTGAGEPRNLGDYVDVGGKNFSAGERQRLCFARAILARPQLLVLDEATANLDVETESKMAELLAELKSQCTTLVVSHRPGILAHADVIWDLNELKGVAKSVS